MGDTINKYKTWADERADKRDKRANVLAQAGLAPRPWWRRHRIAGGVGFVLLAVGGVNCLGDSMKDGSATRIASNAGSGLGDSARTVFGGIGGGGAEVGNAFVEGATGGECVDQFIFEVGNCEGSGGGQSNSGNGDLPTVEIGGGDGGGDELPPTNGGGGNGSRLTVAAGWGATNVLRNCGMTVNYSDLSNWAEVVAVNPGLGADPNNPGLDPGEEIVCP